MSDMDIFSPTARKIAVASLVAAILFFVVLRLGLGSFFMFLPSLPLFYVGLSDGARPALRVALIASMLVVLGAGIGGGIAFGIMIGLPAAYFADCCLRHKLDANGEKHWFPLGMALTNLTLSAAGLLSLVAFIMALSPQNLPELLSSYVRMALSSLSTEFGPEIEIMATGWLFLPLAITIWMWGIGLFVHAWVAHRFLQKRGQTPRPSIALTPFVIPSWMLYLLAICALASMIGGESMSFMGKTLLLVLALPYFFSGLANMHEASKNWPNRRFFLFIIYFFLIGLFWPALIIAASGFWHQLKKAI